MTTQIVSASTNPIKVIVKQGGAKGDTGDAGANGAGLNNARKVVLDNPMLRAFKFNKISEVTSPNGDASDISNTRASEKRYTDFYNVVQVASNNEIPEEKEGFLIEPTSTNIFSRSEQLNQAPWSQGLYTGGTPSWTLTVGTSDIPDIYGGSAANKLVSLGTFATVAIQTGLTINNGDVVSASFYIYVPSSLGYTDFTVFGDFNSPDGFNTFTLNQFDRWVRVKLKSVATASASAYRIGVSGGALPVGQTIYAMGFQAEKFKKVTSYIKTLGSSATRLGDNVTMAAKDNAPSLVDPFTLMIHVSDLDMEDTVGRFFWGVDSVPLPSYSRLTKEANTANILFRLSDGTVDTDTRFSLTDPEARFVFIVFDGSELRMYQDDLLRVTNTAIDSKPLVNTNANMYIGSNNNGANGYPANYRDMRFWQEALSQDEISLLVGGL